MNYEKQLDMLRQLQLLELEILLEVDRVCKKHNITYYLGEGSLLGAIRHNGFIPWDDDIDILMKREDYEKFLQIAPVELGKDYFLQNSFSEKKFWVFFSKVRLLRKTDFNQLDISNLTEHNGPYIDVFPLDYVPRKASFKQLYTAKKIKAYRYILFYKTRALKKPKNKKRKLLYYLSKFYTVKHLHNELYKQSTKFNHKSHKYLVNYCSYYNTTEQTIPVNFYDEPKYVKFEGHLLPVPNKADYILTSIYGDYMTLPPLEKRVIKHKFPAHLTSKKLEFITKIDTEIKMKDDIKISIIIPVYNSEKYVVETLKSLDNQTFPYHELIIINDGSTDNSEQVIKNYIKNKKNVKYIAQENKKQGYTRNLGVKKATGNYIMFLDADDFIEPRTLELCVEKVKEEDPDFVNFEWKKYLDEKNTFLYDRVNKKIDGKDILLDDECKLLLTEKLYYTVTRLYRKNFLIDNDIKYGEGYFYEDHVFFIKTALKAKKISLIHSPLYCYRIHSKATTKDKFDTDIHCTSLIKSIQDTFNIENVDNNSFSYILNHILERFITIYRTRTPNEFKEQFVLNFFNLMNDKEVFYHSSLNSKWKKLLKEQVIKTKNVKKFVKIITKFSIKNKLTKEYKKFKKYVKNWKYIYYKLNIKGKIYKDSILFMGFDYRYAGNSKYLFEQMLEKYPNNKYYFVTDDKNIKNRIKPNSLKFYRYLARCKIIILESWIFKYLSKRNDQVWLQTWHATTVKKLLFDTSENLTMKKNPHQKILKYKEILNWNYLIVDSKTIVPYFETAFMLKKDQILPFGYPRVKYLLENKNNENKKNDIKLSFGLPLDKKIVLYAPTWRDYNVGVNDYSLNFSYLLDLEKLQDLLGEDYVVVFKDHNFKSKTDNLKGNYINGNNFETQDIILASDYVISVYSSIVFDAMAIDIPILIYANDIMEYEKCRGVYKDIFNDLLTYAVKDEEDLTKKIKSYKIDKKYETIKNKYCYQENNDQLLNFLNELLK